MAIKYYERYPQRWESPSQDYPQGAFKDLSAIGKQDGSYLQQDWLNDLSGFFGALLHNAEMTPNGLIDTAQKSQFYEALIKVAKQEINLQNSWGNSLTDTINQSFLSNNLRGVSVGGTDGFLMNNGSKITLPKKDGEMLLDSDLTSSVQEGLNKPVMSGAVADTFKNYRLLDNLTFTANPSGWTTITLTNTSGDLLIMRTNTGGCFITDRVNGKDTYYEFPKGAGGIIATREWALTNIGGGSGGGDGGTILGGEQSVTHTGSSAGDSLVLAMNKVPANSVVTRSASSGSAPNYTITVYFRPITRL